MCTTRSKSFVCCSRFFGALVFHELRWCYLEYNSSQNDHNWSQNDQVPTSRVFRVLNGISTFVVMQDCSREVILGNLQRRLADTDSPLRGCADELIATIRQRVADLVKVPMHLAEDMQVR